MGKKLFLAVFFNSCNNQENSVSFDSLTTHEGKHHHRLISGV
ncbi:MULTISPECIES: hypothetical protein [Chryseobacterium]|uniref:Uncharacterized protein n=1 Tax=Chryseobacterium fistulae TaxID=2675058 RepID=A0A6N4XYZ1_9FLAO|nr:MULTISPECIES: hypothetical protein [Chryseobacterium]CAA7392606.1 hypothetical protein CHRY9393_03331 [Chryseobacterium fistulae]